jgi:hypothetical protein
MSASAPNPLLVFLLKTAAYTALGWVIAKRAERPRSALGFGVIRVALGWTVGIPALLVASNAARALRGDEWLMISLLTVPRTAIWAPLIWLYYRPHGGTRALALWTLTGVALSTLTDALILTALRQIPGFWLGFC